MKKTTVYYKEEIVDWEDVNEVFGDVYSKNPFWTLREKKTPIQKVKDELNLIQKLISDLESNISKRMSKNLTPSASSSSKGANVNDERSPSVPKGSMRGRSSVMDH